MNRRSVPQPILVLLPMGLTVAAYARVLHGEFQFDDVAQIERNPAIKALGNVGGDALLASWSSARPVTQFTFALNYALGRLDPFGYHVVNLAIHLAAVALVWVLTNRLARLSGHPRAGWIAFAVAGLFAVHPIQTQAVSYVSQRSEVLGSALYVGTILLLMEAERRGLGPRAAAAYAAALVCYVLALGAKPIAITAPVAYLLVAFALAGAPGSDGQLTTWKRRLAFASPLVAIAALFAAGTMRGVRGRPDAGVDVPGLSPWHYLLTQTRAVVGYLRLLFWPAGQNVDWDFRISRTPMDPAVLGSTAVLLALVAIAIALVVLGRRGTDPAAAGASRLAGLGIAWFFVVLSVTSSFVPLVDPFVEHRPYLASWGIFLAVAVAAERLTAAEARARGPVALAALAAAFALLAAVTHRRNAVWETSESLWRDVVSKAPENARARLSLGAALGEQNRQPEAIEQYEAGLRLALGNTVLQARLYRNLGASCLAAGRLPEATAAFQRGLALEPANADLLVNMSLVGMRSGDLTGAETWARRALAVAPGQPAAWNVLGSVLLERDDPGAALPALDRAAREDADLGEVHLNRALALDRLGRKPEACAALRDAWAARLLAPERAIVGRLLALHCR